MTERMSEQKDEIFTHFILHLEFILYLCKRNAVINRHKICSNNFFSSQICLRRKIKVIHKIVKMGHKNWFGMKEYT